MPKSLEKNLSILDCSHLSIFLSWIICIYLSIYLSHSVQISIYLSHSVQISIYLSHSVQISIYLSIYLSISNIDLFLSGSYSCAFDVLIWKNMIWLSIYLFWMNCQFNFFLFMSKIKTFLKNLILFGYLEGIFDLLQTFCHVYNYYHLTLA